MHQFVKIKHSFLFMSHDNYTKQQQLSPLVAEAPWDYGGWPDRIARDLTTVAIHYK